MTVWNSLRSTFLAALHHPRLWLLQFVGNLIIVFLFGVWLHLSETWFGLVCQFVIVLALLVGALVLQSGTMNYFAEASEASKSSLAPAFRKALKHLPAFALSVAILYTILHFVDKLDDYQYSFPGYLRSEFPAWLRRHVAENALQNWYAGLVGLLRWVIVPGIVLPFWLLCAEAGFSGFIRLRAWVRCVGRFSYWIALLLAALIGVYCTGKIMHWTLNPKGPAVTEEEMWLGFRLFAVYLMTLFSWFWVCAMLARDRSSPESEAASAKIAA